MSALNPHRAVRLALLLALGTTPVSCDGNGSRPAPQAAIAVTDAFGRRVSVETPARRVVSLAPSATEILFAIGAGDLVIARDEHSDYPPAAAAIQSLGNPYPRLNLETVVALAPDLVVAGGVTSPEEVRGLADVGITVLATSIASRLGDIYADIEAIGRLTGRSGAAATLVASMRRRARSIEERAASTERRPRVFYEIDATDPSKPWTAGPDSFIDQMVEIAGGRNIGRCGHRKYFQISLETLVVSDPEIIILGSARHGGQTPEAVGRRVGWSGIAAVERDRVYPFDDDLVSRPGPRVVDGLEAMARLIHPEIFDG